MTGEGRILSDCGMGAQQPDVAWNSHWSHNREKVAHRGSGFRVRAVLIVMAFSIFEDSRAWGKRIDLPIVQLRGAILGVI